ncbi:MAG: hypothetical protein U0Z75_04420 [Deinococcaceae bacterium]
MKLFSTIATLSVLVFSSAFAESGIRWTAGLDIAPYSDDIKRFGNPGVRVGFEWQLSQNWAIDTNILWSEILGLSIGTKWFQDDIHSGFYGGGSLGFGIDPNINWYNGESLFAWQLGGFSGYRFPAGEHTSADIQAGIFNILNSTTDKSRWTAQLSGNVQMGW